MAEERRIVFGTNVIPTKSIEGEEASIRHTEFQSSSGGILGGKGVLPINGSQNDGWVSFSHNEAAWEDQGDVWEFIGETWSGELEVDDGRLQLSSSTSDLGFLYIKNTGSADNCTVSLNGVSGDYYIIIPPEGSIGLRGDGATLECNEVYVTAGMGTTTIEYIVSTE
jgi:hypothetical protein